MMRESIRSLVLCVVGLASACSANGPTTVATAPTVSAPPQVASNPPSPSPVYPTQIPDLGAAVPKDAALVVGLPAPGAQLGILQSLAAAVEVAKLTNLPESALKGVIDSFDGADFFVVAKSENAPALTAGVMRFRDPKLVEALFAAAKMRQVDAIHWALERGDRTLIVAWLAEPRVAIVSFDTASVDAALKTLASGSSFATVPLPHKPEAGAGWLVADLVRLAPGVDDLMGPGSRLFIEAGSKGAVVDYVENGARVPRIGQVLAPTSHELLAKLPTAALFGLDLSLRRQSGKTFRDVLVELARLDGSDLAGPLESTLKSTAHVSLDDLDRMIGDDLALGIYMDKKGASDPERRFKESGVILGAMSTRDDKTARALVDALAHEIKSKKGVTSSPGKITQEISDGVFRIEVQKGSIVVAYGAKKATSDMLAIMSSGKSSLATSATFGEYKRKATKESHFSFFADLVGTVAALGAAVAPPDGPLKDVLASGSLVTGDVTALPSDKGLELSLRGDGSVGIVGVVSAVSVYGVRQYLRESKMVEAKSTLHALARSALSSYERELPTSKSAKDAHALCRSASPVPATVKHGEKYMPSAEKGQDFQAGDDQTGWRCLRFSMDEPFYYQYDYRQGSGYKGPARGGPNPGPNGFEVSAEGDLDGNGKTSLFTMTGKITKKGTIELQHEIFVSDGTE